MSRYGINLLLSSDGFPFHTLLVNILGCFLLALAIEYLSAIPKIPHQLVSGLGTGFLGAFTTFSAFSAENAHLLLEGSYTIAALYIISSLIGGFFSAGLGFLFCRKWLQRGNEAED
ncbi:CrcB family protein [Clostridiales bacterium BAD-6]|uniref:Fluoride-specific ion channel FluC n=2 Tax=Sinanaerobacter chloroacetimidivorans TaxID=2818044 RepID=A0A8J7W4M4_9FIRM|nr:CrcB family protein [Sinanaerobacter chloroacetimidivorans]